jgi:fructokinase
MTIMPGILVPGTVLLDIYEDSGEQFLGGAEFNFAFHIHRLVGSVDFIARVGRDKAGEFILDRLEQHGFPIGLIQVDPVKKSKTVLVQKNEKNDPVYLIPSNVASEFLEYPAALSTARLADYQLIYFGTTLQHGSASRGILRRLLSESAGLKFCDLNLRAGKYSREIVDYSLRTCDILKINHEELSVLAEWFELAGGPEAQIRELSRVFHIPRVCLTLAEKGSWLLEENRLYQKTISPGRVKDTVGAGDGFSACLALGLLQAWPAAEILDFASDFAAAICGLQGAISLDPEFYRDFLDRLRRRQ